MIVLAQDESRRMKYDYVGTEHLLLGLIRLREGTAIRVLEQLGVNVDQVREEIEAMIGPGMGQVRGEIGFTPWAKKVMVELAPQEARELGHPYVGSEHILLGLLREGEGVAAQVLRKFGAEAEKLRSITEHLLGSVRPERRAEAPVREGRPEPSPRALPAVPLSRSVRNVLLHLANEEAALLKSPLIQPEHLLLGILRDAAPSVAGEVLREKGITLEWLRARLEQGE